MLIIIGVASLADKKHRCHILSLNQISPICDQGMLVKLQCERIRHNFPLFFSLKNVSKNSFEKWCFDFKFLSEASNFAGQ